MANIQSAVFFGSKKEFKKYIGPRLRNLVQNLTKVYKGEMEFCEHCNRSKDLESAHVHGQERTTIVNEILKEFLFHGGYQINLMEFERKFKERHSNLKDIIKVLCKDCHIKYDSNNKVNTIISESIKPEYTIPFNSNTVEEYPQMKIGKLVRETLPIMLHEGVISASEIEKMQEYDYSKITFDINYPVLKKIDFNISLMENRMINNYTRYYAFIATYQNQQYLISSEWYERNLVSYKRWLKKNTNNSSNNFNLN